MGLGDPPFEYLELIACRDLYHCTPLELARVPLGTVLAHLACQAGENAYRNHKDEFAEDE